MIILDRETYRAAFAEYLRKGTPVRTFLKEAQATSHYVWQTQRDEKVRPEHRANDGRIFSWNDHPATGHPGEDYNCRCFATPYVAGETEYAFHDFKTDFGSSKDRWYDRDFVHHYYFGDGAAVTLREIGHLQEIAEHYAYSDGTEGAFRRLTDQIVVEARIKGPGIFVYEFRGSYDFEEVEFSHGGGVVTGRFEGRADYSGDMILIAGRSNFQFSDSFENPLDLGIEAGGTPYAITGEWSASFTAEVFQDNTPSRYGRRCSNVMPWRMAGCPVAGCVE